MDAEIRNNNMLEYGEHNGNIYGTHLDSIRNVIQQGKMCVLDCAPNSLKLLHNSQEFLPYVVFIGAPGMDQLKQIYAERRATGGSQRNLAVCNRGDMTGGSVTNDGSSCAVRSTVLHQVQFEACQDTGVSGLAL